MPIPIDQFLASKRKTISPRIQQQKVLPITPQVTLPGVGPMNIKSAKVGPYTLEAPGYQSAGERKVEKEMSQQEGRANYLVDLFKKTEPFVRSNTISGRKITSNLPLLKDTGVEAGVTGLEAKGRAKMGLYKDSGDQVGFDDVGAYEDLKGAFVTTLARMAGEQRVSDQDARRFASALMDYQKSKGRNTILMDALEKDFSTKSAGQILSEYTGNPAYLQEERKKFGNNLQPANTMLSKDEEWNRLGNKLQKSTSQPTTRVAGKYKITQIG